MDRKDYLTKLTQEDRELIKLFQDEVDRINLLYMKAVNSNDMTKANQLLKQIKKINNHLANEYGKRAEIRIPQEYAKGSSYIDDVLGMDTENTLEEILFGKTKVAEYIDELGPIHKEAVNALVDNSKNYVKASLDGMERQALTMINELQQYQVRQELAKGIISGEASSNERLIDYFTSQGISGFKDRGGKYWSMDRYVDMLTRTETAIANTQGTINRAIEVGITKFGIVEHSDCCEVCAEMNGDIVDITEGTVELPPFHPNCRGYIVAIVDEEEWRNRLIEPEQINTIEQSTEQPESNGFKLTEEMKQDPDVKQAMRTIEVREGRGQKFPMGYDKAVAIATYTTQSYRDINNYLRENIGGGIYKDLADGIAETLDNYGEISTNTLYRGTKLPLEVFDEMINTKSFKDKAFLSFAPTEMGASEFMNGTDPLKRRVLFELDNGKGMDVRSMSVYRGEQEFLINRGTNFEVLNVDEIEDNKGTYFKIKIKQIY